MQSHSKKDIKLEFNPGVVLEPTERIGISRAIVIDAEKRFVLSWDRFNRLHQVAKAIQEGTEPDRVLDVGGFDGALALFLPDFEVDVIDPITTGGTGLDITATQYPIVVSIDAIEHIAPPDRDDFFEELIRVTSRKCFVNFPARRSVEAQRLVFELTDNPLIKEHVEWELPSTVHLCEMLIDRFMETQVIEHTSLSQWVSQYLLQTESPEIAARANSYLIRNHSGESNGITLYDLVIGTKRE